MNWPFVYDAIAQYPADGLDAAVCEVYAPYIYWSEFSHSGRFLKCAIELASYTCVPQFWMLVPEGA